MLSQGQSEPAARFGDLIFAGPGMSKLTPAPATRVHDPSGVATHGVALGSAGASPFRSERVMRCLYHVCSLWLEKRTALQLVNLAPARLASPAQRLGRSTRPPTMLLSEMSRPLGLEIDQEATWNCAYIASAPSTTRCQKDFTKRVKPRRTFHVPMFVDASHACAHDCSRLASGRSGSVGDKGRHAQL
jgi:hypothetical protein